MDPIIVTPAAPGGPLAAYNTLATARATASSFGLSRITVATDAALGAALMLACIDVDTGMRYQGSKYDPDGSITGTKQVREFPRWENGMPANGLGEWWRSPMYAGHVNMSVIWDWDAATNTVVVPPDVLTAEVLQADSILAGDRQDRLQAITDGLTGQAAGSLSENYLRMATDPQPMCVRAARIMGRFRLRSGAML